MTTLLRVEMVLRELGFDTNSRARPKSDSLGTKCTSRRIFALTKQKKSCLQLTIGVTTFTVMSPLRMSSIPLYVPMDQAGGFVDSVKEMQSLCNLCSNAQSNIPPQTQTPLWLVATNYHKIVM